jgi:hypothetical protein
VEESASDGFSSRMRARALSASREFLVASPTISTPKSGVTSLGASCAERRFC